ncbi:R3H domain-containing nucleic acid-binding protein [Methylothermus subterraneus]|nr:single-stranded nucleic acid binding R3H [uncultured Gammaproteobacteria bacterium]
MSIYPVNDDLELLLQTLPGSLRDRLAELPNEDLLEIVLDLGRPPQARYADRSLLLAETPVTRADLNYVVDWVGEFGADNRAGIEGTLHRISAIRNRKGEIVGLTLRVGRAVTGTIDLIRDLIESGRSLLLLGRPGVGKTTKLREVARVLADDFGKRVIVIDTSNEIGGDGDVPHPAIGSARRMQVPHPDKQHAVMIEAVENHMPEVIVIDEIGTAAEALAARTIAERGVQLIGTAHGNTLANLVQNPTLCDLVGGVQTVTLGDEEARFRGTQKTVSERKAPPTFEQVVELVSRDELIVHLDTAAAVDALLRGEDAGGVRRTAAGETPVAMSQSASPFPGQALSPELLKGEIRIYPYAISRDLVERVIRSFRFDARTVANPERADMVLALRSRAEDARLRRILNAYKLPLHCVKKSTTAQIRRLLLHVFSLPVDAADGDEVEAAVNETEAAVRKVLEESVAVELAPQPREIRKIQHHIVNRYHLVAESVGCDPFRRLVIYPG